MFTLEDVVLTSPKKAIERIDILPIADAVKYGGPPASTKELKDLFKDAKEMFVVHFAPYTEEELEKIPDKKTKAALETLKAAP